MNPRHLLRSATLRLNRARAPTSIPTQSVHGEPPRGSKARRVEIPAVGTDEEWNA